MIDSNILTVSQRLHEAIAATGCPITGVSIGTPGITASASIQFGNATPAQKTAAQTALTGFDWSDAGYTAWFNARDPERTTLRNQAAQAVTDINTYLALPSPTPVQVATMVSKLCVDMRAVIQRLIQVD